MYVYFGGREGCVGVIVVWLFAVFFGSILVVLFVDCLV